MFYDIHCKDPFHSKKCFEFPVVVLHETGIHLFVLLDETEKVLKQHSELDYISRVFKSYFSTKLPIRTMLMFRKGDSLEHKSNLIVYDFCDKKFLNDNEICSFDDVLSFLKSHFETDNKTTSVSEQDELVLRLSKESSDPLENRFAEQDCFVKKRGEWVPAFNKEPEKVFQLALFGGFLGLHRFYLQSFFSGFLYFVSFGGFGICWFFDCIEIILGCFKSKGRVLLPLPNKKKYVIELVTVFGCLGVCLFLLLSSFS